MTAQAHVDTVDAVDVRRLREVTDATAAILMDPIRRRAAVSYLQQRGVDATKLGGEWSLGYAPPGWTRLVERLRHSFSEEALLAAGVARRSSRGSLIDAFRDRVVFGIRSGDGALAGFIGRDLSGAPGAPKYLNTRQHALFDKGALLFGLHEGATNDGAKQPVVVEGPLDVLAIAARQRDLGESGLLPAAPSGTAFTLTQAQRVAEITFHHQSPVLVAMDGDAAGRSAALDAGERLRHLGVDVRVAVLPNGADPAEYLARPGSTLESFRAESGLPLLSLHVENAIARQGDRMQWVEGRLAALRSVAGYLATYPPSYAARQMSWLAESLQVARPTVEHEVAVAYRQIRPAAPEIAARPARSISIGAGR